MGTDFRRNYDYICHYQSLSDSILELVEDTRHLIFQVLLATELHSWSHGAIKLVINRKTEAGVPLQYPVRHIETTIFDHPVCFLTHIDEVETQSASIVSINHQETATPSSEFLLPP